MVLQHYYLSRVNRKGSKKKDKEILINTGVSSNISNVNIENTIYEYLTRDVMGNTGITLFQFLKLNSHERMFLLKTLEEHFKNVEMAMKKKNHEFDK